MLLPACSSDFDEIEEPQKSFLWEVTSESTTVYLLGSIHMAGSELYPLDDTIEEAFHSSQNLVVELDITGVDEDHLIGLMMYQATYQEGETLRENIPENLYLQIDEYLREFNLNAQLVNMFEPWFVTSMIEELQLSAFGYSSDYGIDVHFLDQAHSRNMDILELESVDYQLAIFDTLDDDLQLLMLEDTIENSPSKKEMEKMFTAWETGDIAEMERIVFEDIDDNADIEAINDIILDERNFQMVEKIEDYLNDDEVYFVVVGAGHLIGENGIISLLEQKGYTANQL